jgi:hypothetical protein
MNGIQQTIDAAEARIAALEARNNAEEKSRKP